MTNTSEQKLKEYFLDLIPDNSVFNLLGQQLYSGQGFENANNFPYYWYDADDDYRMKINNNTLHRGYFRIEHNIKENVIIDDLISGTDINECAVIIDTFPNRLTEEYTTYLAYWDRYGIPTFKTSSIRSILGVGF